MAGNSEQIRDLISDETFQELDKLESQLVSNKKAFVDAAKSAKAFTDAIGGVKNIKDFAAAVQNAAKGNATLLDSQEKIRLAEIQLETARRKAFDDFEKRLQQQIQSDTMLRNARIKSVDKAIRDEARLEAAQAKASAKLIADQQKQVQSDTALRNARIRNIDEYNKRLASQRDAQEKAAIAQLRTATAAREANLPYNRLNAELGVLRTRARDIGVEFGINSRQFRDAAASVQVLDRQLRTVDDRLGQNQRSVDRYGDALNGIRGQFAGIAASYLSVYAVLGGLSKVVTANKEIQDSLSDVQRTAGLTADEAENLANQLKKIDTRTDLKGLIDIATIGGQLGIAKDDLAGFTKAIDQLAVTLKGEIPGGAEAVAAALGKINGVFKVQQKEGTNTEEALNKTGSAILRLGQAGLATGEYLQDFTLRTAGTAQVAKIALPTILAYSAVLEEAGTSAEVAGTAFNLLVGSLAAKREKFFQIAKIGDATLTLKDFTKLINTDANAALQKFFIGLNRGGKDLTSFTDLLGELKIKTGPGKNAIIALAQNQELLNERIGQSVTAYNEGTLAAEQFAVKNDNLAGSLDKVSNELTKISTGKGIAGVIKSASDAIVVLLRETDKLFASRSWQEVVGRLFYSGEGERYDKFNNIQDRFNSAQKVAGTSQTPTFGKRSGNSTVDYLTGQVTSKEEASKSKLELLKDFKETRKAALTALTAYNEFKNAIAAGKLRDPNGELQQYKALSDTLNTRAIALKEAYRVAKDVVKVKPTAGGTYDKPKSAADIKKEESLAQKRIKLLAESYDAEAALTIANAKKVYKLGDKEAADTVIFENKKAEALNLSIDKKQKLYTKDSINYKKLEIEKIDVNTKAQEAIREAIKDGIEKETKLRDKAAKNRILAIETEEDEALLALDTSFNKGEISQEDYEKKRLEIITKYSKLALEQQANDIQSLIDYQKKNGIDTVEEERKLAAIRLKIQTDLSAKKIDDAEIFDKEMDDLIKKQVTREEELRDVKFKIAEELLNLAQAVGGGIFTRELNQVQELIDANETKKAADIENVNESVATEEEKADKIAIINARAAAQQELLDQKKRQIQERQAKFEKAATIASIVLNTAKAIVGHLLTPYLIPFDVAIGAIQLATAIATPIPKFEHGGVMRENGLAMFGEAGTELRINPSGQTEFTPDTPTIGYVEAGTRFISNRDMIKLMGSPDAIDYPDKVMDLSPVTREIIRGNASVVKAIKANRTVVQGASKRGMLLDAERMRKMNGYYKRNGG